MNFSDFDPGRVLNGGITKLSRQELCEFVSRLCRRVVSEVGTRGRRGGIYPSNISVGEDGAIGLGPAGVSPWEGEELLFVAPELYWNGQCSAASDVYSVGLLLYYAVSGGRLPLEEECKDAQLRRMGGDDLSAPKNSGRRLGEIIGKCLRFKAADRYQTLEELRVVLDSCVKNLYLSGAPSAEVIFKKNDDDLTEVERMMVGIIEKGETEESPEAAAPAEADAAPPEPEEGVRLYAPDKVKTEARAVRAAPPEAVARQIKNGDRPAAPKLRDDKEPLRPVVPERAAPAVQRGRNAERERKIAEEVKKRRRRPLAVILVLCALLVVIAIVFNAMLKDFQQASQIPDNTISGMEADPYAGTPVPESGSDGAQEGGEADGLVGLDDPNAEPATDDGQTPDVPQGHSYELFVEDVSWTEARNQCIAKGGHLVVISDKAELEEIVALAEGRGVDKLWIGCHRIDGQLIWEADEEGYFEWAKGEPSYVDVNDDVAEDYIMLWNHNGWVYNDNRNDPIKDYPGMYAGTVGYICEYGDGE